MIMIMIMITLCKPCNNHAQKQPALLSPGWKKLPKRLVHVQTKTGASAAQHPLQRNQISCAQHHQLNLHHNVDTELSPLYSCIPIATRLHCQPMRSSSKLCQMLVLTPSANSLQIGSWSVARRIYRRSQVQVLLHLNTTASIYRLQVATMRLLHNSNDIHWLWSNEVARHG